MSTTVLRRNEKAEAMGSRSDNDKDKGATPKELVHIDPLDLHELLATRPERLLGRIIELNRGSRYNNSLDAISLVQRLLELRERVPPTTERRA